MRSEPGSGRGQRRGPAAGATLAPLALGLALALGLLGWSGAPPTALAQPAVGGSSTVVQREAGPAQSATTPGPALVAEQLGQASVPGKQVEEIEEVDVVQPAAALAADGAAGVGVGDWIGRLHPAVVHLPIGWLLLLGLLDLAILVGGRSSWAGAGLFVHVATVVSFLPAVISGLLREDHVARAGGLAAVLELHELTMLVLGGVVLVALLVRLLRHNRLDGRFRPLHLALLGVALVLVTIGGHLGGRLVYGDNYLPVPLPF